MSRYRLVGWGLSYGEALFFCRAEHGTGNRGPGRLSRNDKLVVYWAGPAV
jgi:hypothetical protein